MATVLYGRKMLRCAPSAVFFLYPHLDECIRRECLLLMSNLKPFVPSLLYSVSQRTDVDDKLKALRLSLGMVSASTTSLQHTVEPVQQAAVEQLCSFIRQYGLSDLVQRRLGELNGMGPQSASSTSNGASHGAAGVTSSDAALSASIAELRKELS